VLLPSLGLLAQTLREWTFAAATPFEVLCVCSDQTVGSKGYDEAIHSVADLAFPVTSDADEVKRFLSGAGNRVVSSLCGKMLWSILFPVSLFVGPASRGLLIVMRSRLEHVQ